MTDESIAAACPHGIGTQFKCGKCAVTIIWPQAQSEPIPESDLFDDIIVKIKFEKLSRAEEYEQLRRVRASPEVLRASSGSLSDADEHTDLLQRLEHFVSFLCGAAEIDGVSFGDRHPEHKGGFWWRTPLRSLEKELFATLSPSGPMISLNAVAAGPSMSMFANREDYEKAVAAEARSPSPDQSTRNTEWISVGDTLHDSDCAVHNAPALPVGPCDCSASWRAKLAEQCGKTLALSELANALIAKLDAVRPYITSMHAMEQNRGIRYNGPTYGVELEALRAALANTQGAEP